MADDEKLWVQVCKLKYCPIVGFWRARRNQGCSKMWGQVLNSRHLFREQVFWHVGNGKTVTALSQPWFQSWTVQEMANPTDRKLKVCSLMDDRTGQWKMHELQRLFQPNQVQQILIGAGKPAPQVGDKDRLIWKLTKNGKYSVREGYKMIIGGDDGMTDTHSFDWNIIWKWKSLEPKVKIFLWRLVHKGLPMAANLHNRIRNFDPICQRCNQENEYEMHCLFFCNTSRQVWFGGQLGIKVHELPLEITQTVTQMLNCLDEEGVRVFANTMWEIWKERNKAVIEHKVFQPCKVMQRINAGLRSELLAINATLRDTQLASKEKYEFLAQGWQVLVDASWQVGGRAGGAYVVYSKGEIHSVGLNFFNIEDPFQAETRALMEAVSYVYEQLNVHIHTPVQFFSDCFNLVLAVNHVDTTDLPSWRAEQMVNCVIRKTLVENGRMMVKHVKREAVYPAHHLANLARRNALQYNGLPHMALQQHGKIERKIDEKFFQRVQDEPP